MPFQKKVGKEFRDKSFEEKNDERLRSDFWCKKVGIEGLFSNTEFTKRAINKAIKCPCTKKYR